MARQHSDPLVQCVFEEIEALWAELDPADRPLLLRVEQRISTSPHPNGPVAPGRLIGIWLFDDHGARLAPVLSREPHDFGTARGQFSEYGLVRFCIEPDRESLVFEYHLGPGIGGEIHYGIEEEAGDFRLLAHSGTLT